MTDILVGGSGRQFERLPFVAAEGFPQMISFRRDDGTYWLRLHVNVPFDSGLDAILELPTDRACLIARLEVEQPGGVRETVFVRKVVPELEYASAGLVLAFPTQRVAVRNLNGRGEFGSVVDVGVASQWA